MKDLFPGYYPMNEDEEREFWSSCLFVFDANVLLNLYCMKPEDRQRSLKLLRELGDRLWIPHQVAAEYQRRRVKVIKEQIEHIRALSNKVKDAEKLIRNGLPEQHQFSGADKDQDDACSACQRVWKSLGSKGGHYQRLLKNDTVRNELDAILQGRVGGPYEPTELLRLLRRGEKRYAIRFPPGFADDHKRGASAFGDWILWSQILDKVRAEKRPVLFVTDDMKEDWWITDPSGDHWPRDELISEIWHTAGVTLRLYTSKSFLTKASEHLGRSSAAMAGQLSNSGAWNAYLAGIQGMLRIQKEMASQRSWLPSALEAARLSAQYLHHSPWLTSAVAQAVRQAEKVGRYYSPAVLQVLRAMSQEMRQHDQEMLDCITRSSKPMTSPSG